MFDIKSFLKRGIEKELLDVDDYIFMPENVEMVVEEGELKCVLNSDGRVNIFYTKQGVTDVRAAARKHPFTSFDQELNHGIYDDVIDDLVKEVNKILDGKSKYFHNVVLPSTASLPLTAPLKPEPFATDKF
ncbi:hypothetical protein [Psychrobacter sp. LV10R520-6]|uniref:hypothetical protein n=1 Tax=Psychrobacter sp. LV10R520-6 TaxID=1415574 RepID=UPI0024CC8A67|nr:hypothetical protein [Psychrobacter sp. LV10R520-6]SNT70275.1 hypothetical protein SAMN04488491_1427 [Psychrobacter sp. LV10R520-6]